MRLKQMILEGGGTSLNFDDNIQDIIPKISDAWDGYQKGHRIFRGNSQTGDMIHYTGRSGRVSANTKNYYTLVMDSSPKWRKYPKRSESFICSTSDHYASGYGKLYCVFPVNGTTYGIAPEADIWFSFDSTIHGESLNSMIGEIIYKSQDMGISPSYFNVKNMKELKQLDNMFEIRVQEFKDGPIVKGFKQDFIFQHYKGSLIKMIDDIMDPKKNNFEVSKKFTDIPKNSNGQEVWMSGEVYMIRQEYVDTYLQNGPNKTGKEETEMLAKLLRTST